MEKRSRRVFTREFKAEAVALVRSSGESMRQIARGLGLAETSLQRWVARAETDAGPREDLTTPERDELSQVRRELRVVREERDVLAKAIAFFAKGPTR